MLNTLRTLYPKMLNILDKLPDPASPIGIILTLLMLLLGGLRLYRDIRQGIDRDFPPATPPSGAYIIEGSEAQR